MKKAAILFVLMLSCFQIEGYAKDDGGTYVFTEYSPVKIMHVTPGGDVELEASKAGLSGNRRKIDLADIPKDRTDRDLWIFSNGTISVDAKKKSARKKAEEDAAATRQGAVNKLKTTAGLSDDEIKILGLEG